MGLFIHTAPAGQAHSAPWDSSAHARISNYDLIARSTLPKMVVMAIHQIEKPYLLLIGDMKVRANAKTALGLRDWTPEACVAQHRFSTDAVDVGLPDMTPQQAAAAGARTMVIGISPPGGQLPLSWYATLFAALEAGLDIASGLHHRLNAIRELAERAAKLGRKLHDVRHSDAQFSVGSGKPRSGKRVLTVGTDCALGKKYTALAIAKELQRREHDADFRATGQTGILISGRGVAIDAVVADFIAGAAEATSPANAVTHWDVIEGQGSLFHPSYAGVTLGLVHGSQPDAMVLCHDPTRTHINGQEHIALVPLDHAIDAYVRAARLTNPRTRVVGIALNTSALDESAAGQVLHDTSRALALPCVDPIRTGVASIVDELEKI